MRLFRLLMIAAVVSSPEPLVYSALAAQVYSNNFDAPSGTTYPEWSSSVITYASPGKPPGSGTLPAPVITNTVSPNKAQRFLGEFGGPPLGRHIVDVRLYVRRFAGHGSQSTQFQPPNVQT